MSKYYEETNRRLEAGMTTYMDLVDIVANDNGEPMVELTASSHLLVNQRYPEMVPVTGDKIFVRQSVKAMLGAICLDLTEKDKSLQLQVVFGYRSLDIQTKNHGKEKQKLQSQFDGLDLIEAAHRRVAEPTVAGHPTGGAVDVQLARGAVPLPFGTEIRDFVPESYAKSPFVYPVPERNRMLLRQAMVNGGFAPFNGEWWHFSYGDREWAKVSGESEAIYQQIEFSSV
jgi:D-alanyl-D-alanine dipeptidase